MKIAIASDDGRTISSHFGRTRGFVIFEIEDGKVLGEEYRPNTFTGHARGLHHSGHGHYDTHGDIINALRDCNVVISHGMGRRLYDDLRSAGIQVIVTEETDVKRALELYLSGNLKDFPELTD
ncbi:MAG: iron-molybdenum cofactor biosynthesis protein [Dictyoglomus sp. NZ13-RE01]|nr:MAG: iron-molybdenum cofactor biosynthesis protein [Dictyoglomus sp. NZ13-RE01]